jgi:hypothetical protein
VTVHLPGQGGPAPAVSPDQIWACDRWADPAGDHWLVSLTDDGPRMRLCDGDGPPPAKAQPRTLQYVLGQYGPLRLVFRNGTYAVPPVTIPAPVAQGLPKRGSW